MGASGSTEKNQQTHMSLNGEEDAPVQLPPSFQKKEKYDAILSSIWSFTLMLHTHAKILNGEMKYVFMNNLFGRDEFAQMVDAFKTMDRFYSYKKQELIMRIALKLIGFVGEYEPEYHLEYPLKCNSKKVWIKGEIPKAWTDKDAFYSAYKDRILERLKCLEDDE